MNNDRLIPANGNPGVVTTLIKINGEEIPRTFQVLNILIMIEIDKIPFAKIIMKDGDPAQEDFPASNDDLFSPGNAIEVLVGYSANEDLLFSGLIVKQGIKIRQDGSSSLKLDCRDALFKATMVPKNRYFIEVSDSDAIQEIINDYDITADVSASEITYESIIQFEQTDWECVLALARKNSLLCLLDNGELKITKHGFEQDPILTLTYGATILSFDGEIDSRLQYNSLKAQSWDPASQELLEVQAEEPNVEQGGTPSFADLAQVGGDQEYILQNLGQIAQDELQTRANAALQKIRLEKVRGRVRFHGTHLVKPNTVINLQGVGKGLSGPVFVSGVRHEIQGGTWQTDVQFGVPERNGSEMAPFKGSPKAGAKSVISGLQTGVVTQLEGDPAGESRVLVKLPMINMEAQGTWSRMATLDAGANRGTFFVPEIDDEVLVGFINDNPLNPIILGMLHSSVKTSPFEITADNYEKGYTTREGIKLHFNDEKKSINLETPSGKKILIDDDAATITISDKNSNKITLDGDGIIIESGGNLELKATKEIKIDGMMDLKLKAGANFKAEGTTGAELSSSAVAVLKGSLVQIN